MSLFFILCGWILSGQTLYGWIHHFIVFCLYPPFLHSSVSSFLVSLQLFKYLLVFYFNPISWLLKVHILYNIFMIVLRITIYTLNFLKVLFTVRERGREGEIEGNIDVWEKHWLATSCMPPVGRWPTTQACALTGNRMVTLQFAGWCSAHWATPVGATHLTFVVCLLVFYHSK